MKGAVVLGLVSQALAFPWVLEQPGVDAGLLRRGRPLRSRQQVGGPNGGPATCPFNPTHVPAAPITAQFPYNNATNGKRGNGKGGYQVPAPGDTAHQYIAPTSKDIRGPCPGLNVAANHGFLARDGIVTFNELVDAQQNVYNVGYDLALLLATLGLTATDGDIVTERLSIGCDATSRTSVNPTLTGSQPGLSAHNKFEADASLTRNDFFTHNGDDYTFNRTLFDRMNAACAGNFNRDNLSLFRQQRYNESRAENPNFSFGPLTLLLYGAASFLYELMPSGSNGYKPDLATISAFFIDERLPPNWINRVSPYSSRDVGGQIISMYRANPVEFGGNTADGSFTTVSFGYIKDGKLPEADPQVTSCLLYQLATGQITSNANGVLNPTTATLNFVASKLAPEFQNLGCPVPLT